MPWWNELWLNEGFATWMEAKSTAELNPSWDWWRGFDTATDDSLGADARRTTSKVAVPVHNETEANTVFDPAIAYQKAGAFLRMMEAYLGPATFQRGLHSYFVANSYASSTAPDLWHALSAASHQDVGKIAHSWIDEPGFPVVGVSSRCVNGRRTIALTQHRYASFADTSTTIWAIPLEIEAGDGRTKPYLFDSATASVDAGACDAPLIVNGGNLGYYRVAYDDEERALQVRDFQTLSVPDRISLLNDAWKFAVDGKSKLDPYLAYVKADTGDADVHVAGVVLRNLDRIAAFEFGQPGEAAFKASAIAYLRPLLASLGGWDGPTTDAETTQLRSNVLRSLDTMGDVPTIAEARRRYAAGLTDPTTLAPPLKDVVLAIVGREADAQTYGQLIAAGRASHNPLEVQTYFFSAFGAKDPALAQETLNAALTLPPQYSSFAPFVVSIVGQDHPALAWSFLKAHQDKLYAGLSEYDRIPYITGIAESFWRGVPADDIHDYMNANVPAAAKAEVAKAMEDVHRSIDDRERLLPQIDASVTADR
jgi:aminopeptidase N